jgi:hypothetical protein
MPETEREQPFSESELRALVDEQRTRCLWFLRPDFYPESREETVRVLRQIERHGDREAYVRAARMRRWLSQSSSDASAAS